MNSAGMAVLVQVQRMAAPRGIEVALLAPPEAVRRPLQLSGLWRRFPVLDSAADGGVAPASGRRRLLAWPGAAQPRPQPRSRSRRAAADPGGPRAAGAGRSG